MNPTLPGFDAATITAQGCPACVREALDYYRQAAAALSAGAVGAILFHNHPSGEPNPSADDRALTDRLREILAGLDVRLHDHLVLTPGRAYSIAQDAEIDLTA